MTRHFPLAGRRSRLRGRSAAGKSSYRRRPPSPTSSDSSGWITTSEPTEGIVPTDHAAVHGTRLDCGKKQIRLLQIIPLEEDHDGKDETVHCRMFKTFLNDFDPLFNALSYTWGNPDEKTNIVVNETVLSVTTNLESALRHLRDYHINTTCGFPLWVDAICINQDDTEERSAQVDIMGEIYQRAARVLPWLGEGDDDTDWLIPLLRDPDFRTEVAQKANQVDDVAPGSIIIRAVVVSFEDLCRRSWWSRLWVVQEIMLAKRDPILVVGSERFPWSEYVTSFGHLRNIFFRIKHTVEYIAKRNSLYVTAQSDLPFMATIAYPGIYAVDWNDLRSELQNESEDELENRNSICALLAGFATLLGQSATRRADYIYALRGLLPTEEQELISVDYSKPPMEVFHDAMIAVWTSSYSSTWLSGVFSNLQYRRSGIFDNVDDIPSWVPDLSQQSGDLISKYFTSLRSSWKEPIVRVSLDRKTLTLHGIYFDVITESCDVRRRMLFLDGACCFEPDLGDLRHATHLIREALRRQSTPLSFLHATGRACNQEHDTSQIIRTLLRSENLSSLSQHEWLVDEMSRRLLGMADGNCDPSLVSLLQYAEEKMKQRPIGLTARDCVYQLSGALEARLARNSVFSTKSGSFGVGPGHIKAEDRVVFPFGIQEPLIVRPFDPEHPETHEYTVIGVAEIPDLADHRMELDKALEDGLLEEIEIHLK